MAHKDSSIAKDFFLHLLSSITLYMSVIASLMVIFQLINYVFPTGISLGGGDYSSELLRVGLSMLLITLPVFLGTRTMIARLYAKEPQRKEFKIRKWLMYLTLFLSAIIIIVSLIMTLNAFLSGEITVRFVLKAVMTMVIAAVVFSYYLIDVREMLTTRTRMWYLWGAVVSTVILVVGTFVVVGSPSAVRMKRVDMNRLSDLQSITYSIESYYQTHEVLPETLDLLVTAYMSRDMIEDPVTGEVYGYSIIDDTTFSLCAIFDTNTEDQIRRDQSDWFGKEWAHPAGEYCFEKEVGPVMKGILERPIAQ